jgi:hypothetical protein
LPEGIVRVCRGQPIPDSQGSLQARDCRENIVTKDLCAGDPAVRCCELFLRSNIARVRVRQPVADI